MNSYARDLLPRVVVFGVSILLHRRIPNVSNANDDGYTEPLLLLSFPAHKTQKEPVRGVCRYGLVYYAPLCDGMLNWVGVQKP